MANAPDPKTTPAAIKRREETFEKFLAIVPDLEPEDLTIALAALKKRAFDGIEYCWRIDLTGLGGDLEGLVVTEEDVTGIEFENIERATGESFNTINPYRSVTQRNAIIGVALMERRDMTAGQVKDALRKVTARALVKATTEYAVASGPFEDGDPTT